MATIISSNSFNPSNFQAPGVYINNIPPAPYISGAATNVALVIGTASWGPLNAPRIMSSPSDADNYFGGITAAALVDTHDLCTDAAIAFQQGFISLYGCRVSDGTDTAATFALNDTTIPNVVTATVAVGTNPSGVAYCPTNNSLYVANSGANSVSVINAATNVVTATVAVGANPYAVAYCPTNNSLYVANYGAASVSVINAATNVVTATVTVGTNPYRIAYCPTNNSLYVTNIGSSSVSVINAATNVVTATVTVGANPYGVAYCPTNNSLYVTNKGSNSVSVINAATNVVTTTVAVGTNPVGVAYCPTNNSAYVSNLTTNSVSVINAATNAVTTTIAVGASPYDISYVPTNNSLYVAIEGAAVVLMINAATNVVTTTVTVGSNPTGTAYCPTNNSVYVANYGSASVSVVYTASLGGVATALYSGTAGDNITVTIKASQLAGYFDINISSATGTPERYTRIPSAGFWSALATALSSGITGVAGPSNYIRLAPPFGGSLTTTAPGAPAVGTFTLGGGTDGRAVTSAELVGQNNAYPFTGIYTASSLSPVPEKMWIAGLTDTTQAATIQAYCDQQAILSGMAFPVGTTTTTALATINTVGVHDYNFTWLKDWIYWNDTVNGVVRLVAPYGFTMGMITSLSPEQSPLNKAVMGVVGTERNNPYTGNQPYSQAEIGQLENAGVLLITNPIPQGSVFGLATGGNTAINTAESPIEYATMTNFLDQTFAGVLGIFVGQLQSQQKVDPLRTSVKHLLAGFLGGLQQAGKIDQVVQLTCDFAATGNPQQGINTPTTIAAHYLYAYAAVRYLSSVRYFVMSLQGGTTVVSSSPVP